MLLTFPPAHPFVEQAFGSGDDRRDGGEGSDTGEPTKGQRVESGHGDHPWPPCSGGAVAAPGVDLRDGHPSHGLGSGKGGKQGVFTRIDEKGEYRVVRLSGLKFRSAL